MPPSWHTAPLPRGNGRMESIGHCAPQWTDRVAPDGTDNGSLGSGQCIRIDDYSISDELYEDDERQ